MTATPKQLCEEFEVGRASLAEIEVGERERKDFGEVDDLASTIKENGLICPLAVKRLPEASDSKYLLVAGGRRFAACLSAGIGEVPIRIYPESLDEHQLAVIENIENIYRKDFTVEESLSSAKKIHDAKIAIHGEKFSTKKDATGWSQKMTADLLNMSTGATSELLALAAAAEKHPEIGKAKNMSEAKKLAKTIKKNASKSAKAKELERAAANANADDERARLISSYQIGDCFEGMAKLPADTFDLAEIDPPYGIDYKQLKTDSDSGGSTTLNYNEVPAEEYLDFMSNAIIAAKRVLKPNSWLILWHAHMWQDPLYEILIAQGFACRNLTAVWTKPQTSCQTMQPKRYLARGYEQFLYASLGSPEIQIQGHADVFPHKGVPSTSRAHPTERPISLIQDVLSTFTPPGSTVLVPFAGSGNTILAANNCHMTALGFDLTELYKDTFTVKVYEGEVGKYAN